MKKYIVFALVAFAFTLSSCDNSSKSSSPNNPMAPESSQLPNASPNAAVTEKYELNSAIWNPCCNEVINITGTVHYTIKNGVYHFNITQLEGVDANGNTYKGKYHINYNYSSWDGKGADGYTYIVKQSMQSKTGCSFTITYKIQYKLNANGELVVDNVEYVIDCD